MPKFQVGDRVRIVGHTDKADAAQKPLGTLGTVTTPFTVSLDTGPIVRINDPDGYQANIFELVQVGPSDTPIDYLERSLALPILTTEAADFPEYSRGFLEALEGLAKVLGKEIVTTVTTTRRLADA